MTTSTGPSLICWLIIAPALAGCSQQESIAYPSAWPKLVATFAHKQCNAINGIFSDRGSAAEGSAMELGTGTQSVSLSGLLITGNEQASAFAKAARVVSSSSCHVSVDLIESFDRSLPAHFIQSGTDTVVGSRASSDVRSSQGALSSRNIHFAFLEAVDGSLVVKETIRHAAVENLFMPSAEIIVLWFRFPETVSQAS